MVSEWWNKDLAFTTGRIFKQMLKELSTPLLSPSQNSHILASSWIPATVSWSSNKYLISTTDEVDQLFIETWVFQYWSIVKA